MNEQKVMAKTAYLALDEKKGEDICVIDISSISVMADYFVPCKWNEYTTDSGNG